ncbi:MAG: peptide deformylase [bacterium]|nr:peptide deformylase [bacterium]
MISSIDLDRLQIVCYPDPVLRKLCEPVTEFGPALEALGRRMLQMMHDGKGVGLAAPQVGLPLRMLVCNATGEPPGDRIYVNPQLSDLGESEVADEGCLSLPEVTVPMRRAVSATLTACDPSGKDIRVSGKDLEARIWQHEYDHLDAHLIIDHMPTSAELANRRLVKQLEDDYRSRNKKASTR